VNVTSTDASELQRLLISSGAFSDLEEQFHDYGIDLAGKLAFNGTLSGAMKDPVINGHAELGSLSVNKREMGSLVANISSTATEMRVTKDGCASRRRWRTVLCGRAAQRSGQRVNRGDA
jgi:autotransporter translocation and assembly factor TamB